MGNWDTTRLFHDPRYRVIGEQGDLHSILFENEPLAGRPTDVFAYVGIPSGISRPLPAMVCVHGGLGAAFPEWVNAWVARGYAAIAMDLNGCGAGRAPLERCGPAMNDDVIFDPLANWPDRWTYHAVAAVLRAHTILRSFSGVDAARIGITGISWGGYLTCLAASLDPRFACAIPVYGCGFLQSNSAEVWRKRFAAMTPAQRQAWHDHCDPSVYLSAATAPMLFVSGTNDFAYPLDSVRQTYALPRSPVAFCIRADMEHSQEQGCAPNEIAWFADHHLRGLEALPYLGRTTNRGRHLSVTYSSVRPFRAAALHYTTDSGRWQERKWRTVNATPDGRALNATLPGGASAGFFSLTDDRGAYMSSAPREFSALT